jgi:hypothetical protein
MHLGTSPFALALLLSCGREGCEPTTGYRLSRETSTTGEAIDYAYSNGTDVPHTVTVRQQGMLVAELLLGYAPSSDPDMYATSYSEILISYPAQQSPQVSRVEYRLGPEGQTLEVLRYGGDPESLLVRADYSHMPGSGLTDHIYYHAPSGETTAILKIEYDSETDGQITHPRSDDNVIKTTYYAISAGSIRQTHLVTYVWDGRPLTKRSRFMASLYPMGDELAYSDLARSNLVGWSALITDESGAIISSSTKSYIPTYDAASERLMSIMLDGVSWVFSYEDYDVQAW